MTIVLCDAHGPRGTELLAPAAYAGFTRSESIRLVGTELVWDIVEYPFFALAEELPLPGASLVDGRCVVEHESLFNDSLGLLKPVCVQCLKDRHLLP